MQEFVKTLILSEPLLFASMAASLVGLILWYLYRGFIVENYTRIKWFRRILLPHISLFLRHADKKADGWDLSKLYVETSVSEREHAFDIQLNETNDSHKKLKEVGDILISERFRPEVILTSLAEHPDELEEKGNFVLTAPNKSHPKIPGYGIFYEIFVMLTSKYQLHVRYYYDQETNKIRFYCHYELNAYNPLYSKKHFKGEDVDVALGVEMMKQWYSSEFSKVGTVLK